MQKRTDGELLTAYVAGNQSAFEEIVRRYSTPLLRFVNCMVHDKEKSEDIVQETFFRIHQRSGQLQQAEKLSSWLFSIASNLALDELKCANHRRVQLFSAMSTETSSFDREDYRPGPEQDFDNGVLAELISETFARMREPYRSTLMLREVSELNYQEIANATGVSLIAVKMRIMRGREMFANLIQPALQH